MKIGWGARKWLNPEEVVLQRGDLRSFCGCISQNLDDRNESCSKKSIPRRDSKFKGPEDDYRGIFSPAERLVFLSTAKADVMIFLSPVCFSTGELLMQFHRCCPSPSNWGHLSVHLENSDLITYPLQLVPLCVVSPHRGPPTFLLWSGDVSVPSTAQSLEDIWLTTFNLLNIFVEKTGVKEALGFRWSFCLILYACEPPSTCISADCSLLLGFSGPHLSLSFSVAAHSPLYFPVLSGLAISYFFVMSLQLLPSCLTFHLLRNWLKYFYVRFLLRRTLYRPLRW